MLLRKGTHYLRRVLHFKHYTLSLVRHKTSNDTQQAHCHQTSSRFYVVLLSLLYSLRKPYIRLRKTSFVCRAQCRAALDMLNCSSDIFSRPLGGCTRLRIKYLVQLALVMESQKFNSCP